MSGEIICVSGAGDEMTFYTPSIFSSPRQQQQQQPGLNPEPGAVLRRPSSRCRVSRVYHSSNVKVLMKVIS